MLKVYILYINYMDILDLETSFVFTPTQTKDDISDLKIIDSRLLIDEYSNRLLVNKIDIDNKKLYIETDFLKIKNIITNSKDNIAYKIVFEASDKLKNIFNILDEKCKLLLEELVNSDKINTLINNNSTKLFDKIDYYSIINDQTNEFKIYANNLTMVEYESEQISIKDMDINDSVSIVLNIDYISFLIDKSQARTKFYTNFIKVEPVEEVNVEEVNVEEVNVEEVKVEEVKVEEVKVEEVKAEEVKVEKVKAEEVKAEEVKVEEVEEVEEIIITKKQVKTKIEKPKNKSLNNKKKEIKPKINKKKEVVEDNVKEEVKEVKKRGRKPNIKNIINVNE